MTPHIDTILICAMLALTAGAIILAGVVFWGVLATWLSGTDGEGP
jgi:hypothetical protein